MVQTIRQMRIIGLVLLLGGCASTAAREAAAPVAAAPQAPAYSTSGLGGVMGRTAGALVSSFGQPDLDVREGTARKLQFSNQTCILDAYLYPRGGGGEAVVTHVDARLPDGRDVDRASCVAALSLR